MISLAFLSTTYNKRLLMIELYPDLKRFKAVLIRENFEEYFNTEHFRLLSLEKNIDTIFSNSIKEYGSHKKESGINAFLLILQHLMHDWNKAGHDSLYGNKCNYKFSVLIRIVLKGFYSSKNRATEVNKIIDCLRGITILHEKFVKNIEKELINEKEKKELELEKKLPETKNEINIKTLSNLSQELKIDYAIITALEEDEMEKVLTYIDKILEVENTKHYIEIGALKNNPNKKIVYASQHKTGMVDAAILASELILRFKPKFLIMVGVLGGKPDDTSIGDVVIATKVFEIDRGKINEFGFKKEASMTNLTNKEIKKISRSKKRLNLI